MKLKYLCLCVFAWAALGLCRAQSEAVLMFVEGQPVGLDEYRCFCSRRTGADAELERFVDFKLKALAARKASLDTLGDVRLALRNHRSRLVQECLLGSSRTDSVAGECYRSLQTGKYTGRVRVSHIFKYVPQNVPVRMLAEIEAELDSLYRGLQNGQMSFDSCVKCFSEDKKPFWVIPLQMPVEFEDVVFTLQVGEISQPFFTPQGIHIVKVLEREDLPSFDELRDRLVERQFGHVDSRLLASSIDSLKQCYGYTLEKSGVEDLLRTGRTDKVLFVLNGKAYAGADFALFAKSYPASLGRQLEAFIAKSVWDCAYARLGLDDMALRENLCFFGDSLLGSAMTRLAVDNRVKGDTAGVARYFEAHAKRYYWPEARYDGIVLHCKTKRVSKRVRKFLKKLPSDEWEDAIRLGVNAGEQIEVVAERGLFAPGDNAFVDSRIFKKGKPEALADYPYWVILGKKVKGPDCWEEVGLQVWTDYRTDMEESWKRQLRRKFKVEINEEVLKTVNSHGGN